MADYVESRLRYGDSSDLVIRHVHFWYNARKSSLAAIAEMPEAEEGFHVLFLKDCIREKDFEN